jgi:hypothetical protein
MAPRKLIIAMLVLLGFSTGLAVFAPDRPRPERQVVEAEPDGNASPPKGGPGDTGEGDLGASPKVTAPETRRVNVVAGNPSRLVTAMPRERLILTVRSDRTAVIEVTGLGLTGVATRYAPATFDLLLPDRPGRYTVREQRGRQIMKITVRD